MIAGWGHSAVVGDNGGVHICGRNFQGQLGLGDPNKFERNERNHPYLAQFRLIQGKLSVYACVRACLRACRHTERKREGRIWGPIHVPVD